jgi:hypothetical protein
MNTDERGYFDALTERVLLCSTSSAFGASGLLPKFHFQSLIRAGPWRMPWRMGGPPW